VCVCVVKLFLLLVFCKFLVPSRCFISITRKDDFLTHQPQKKMLAKEEV